MTRDNIKLGLVVLGLVACSTSGFVDQGVYVLDPINSNLRGHAEDGSQDRHLSDCDPEPNPSPSPHLAYRCVTHFNADYQILLNKIADLETQLVACQQGK